MLDLKETVKRSIGRELDQPGAVAVVQEAKARGVDLENGEGVDGRGKLEGSVSAESTLVGDDEREKWLGNGRGNAEEGTADLGGGKGLEGEVYNAFKKMGLSDNARLEGSGRQAPTSA